LPNLSVYQNEKCFNDNFQVEKIFGPGNQYVTAAKMILQVCYFRVCHALSIQINTALASLPPSQPNKFAIYSLPVEQ